MSEVPALVLARVADDVAVGQEVRRRAVRRLAGELRRAAQASGGETPVAPVTGALAVFASHTDALRCAASLRDNPALGNLRPRIAVHAGRLDRDGLPDATDWVDGPAVHQTARLASVARSGQVVVSDGVQGRPPEGWARDDTGHHELVGVMGQVRLDRLRPPGERMDWMPPVRSQAVVGGNLLPSEEPMIGRQADLAALTELQELGVRVITVLGDAGVGGGRLCREVAAVSRGHDGGVWWCDARNGAVVEVVRAAGEALGVPLVLGRALDDGILQVGHALAAREASLLVLDGVDSLAEDVARVVRAWCDAAPECRFLVHAPEPLGVPGEVAYRLGRLPVDEALRLFQRAVRRAEAGPLDDAVARGLVATLEHNPLALELVAPLLAQVPGAELVVRLRSQPGGPLRVLALVWNRLPPRAQAVLARCSSFPGAFDLRGAMSLVDRAEDVQPALAELQRTGLVRFHREARAAGVQLYAIDPRVRRFALGRLDEGARRAQLERFADQVLARAEAWAERAWDRDGPEVLARLALARDDLLKVAHWGLTHPESALAALEHAVRAVWCLQPLFLTRGPFAQQRALLDQVLEQCADHPDLLPAIQVDLLLARVDSRRLRGRRARARTDLLRAQSLAERADDTRARARCFYAKGMLAYESGDLPAARSALRRSVVLAAGAGHVRDGAVAASSLGVVQLRMGRPADAEATLRNALADLEAIGSRHYAGLATGNLGGVLRAMGRFVEAGDAYRTAIALHRDTGERRLEAVRVAHLGALATELGELHEAREVWEEAIVLAREVGDRNAEADGLRALGMIALERSNTPSAKGLLSEALAVYRLARDGAGEGAATGYLGVADHLSGMVDAARESYTRALTLLREGEDRATEGVFLAWVGSLEAERGELLAARASFDAAHTLLREAAPANLPIVDLLEASLDVLAARTSLGDTSAYLDAARVRLARAPLDQGPDIRLGITHISSQLGQAAVVVTG